MTTPRERERKRVALRELEKHARYSQFVPRMVPKVDDETLRQRFAECPQYDTRTLTGVICGDPLYERSALAQRERAA